MQRARWCVVLACLVIAAGCGDDGGVGPSDGGVDALVIGDDAEVPVDAQVDASAPDARVAPCEPACGEGEACLRGVCVATCGVDPGLLDGALAAGLAPVAHVCRAVRGPIHVVASGAGMPRVYEVTSETSGETTTFTLARWTLDPAVSAPAPETLATTTHEGHTAAMIYAGGYLALSPDETRAIFGYTTQSAEAIGGVFDVEVGDGTARETGANGNYDGAWLDDTRYVINGLGMEGAPSAGQGLYVRDVAGSTSRRAVDEMGDFSGAVVLFPRLVVASGYFGGVGSRVFVLARGVLDGTEPTSATGAALASFDAPNGFGGGFRPIGGQRIAGPVLDDAWTLIELQARSISETLEGVTVGEPVTLTTGDVFREALGVGEERLLLVHASGLLLVEE